MKKTVKQYQVNAAYGTLRKMMDRTLPLRVSYGLFRLAMELEPNYVFELKRESELVNRYGGTIGKDGQVKFGDEESAAKFREELAELNQFEIDVDIPDIAISLSEDMKLTPEETASLAGFVTFLPA